MIPGAIDTEIWDQPGNDPAPYSGPFEPPGPVAEAICDAILGDGFELYVPDLKAVAEFKTSDIDGFMAGAVGFSEGEAEGHVKALQFLADPEPWPEPLADDAPPLLRNLATTPMALVDLPDPPLLGRRLGGAAAPA